MTAHSPETYREGADELHTGILISEPIHSFDTVIARRHAVLVDRLHTVQGCQSWILRSPAIPLGGGGGSEGNHVDISMLS